MPPILEPVLTDYRNNIPEARDSEVLTLFAAAVEKLEKQLLSEVPKILDHIFECTLEVSPQAIHPHPSFLPPSHAHIFSPLVLVMYMPLSFSLCASSSIQSQMINKNFEDFPEHRLRFFQFLKAVNNHAFEVRPKVPFCLPSLPPRS